MDHYIYFRQLSDEDKLNMKNDLERFGWKIGGEASMAHSPNHIPSESKVSFYILSCPNNKEVQFPEGYFPSNNEKCTLCGLPVSVTYSKTH
nr:hypothetical protein [Paenibacillus xylanexedens]